VRELTGNTKRFTPVLVDISCISSPHSIVLTQVQSQRGRLPLVAS
jgi:hypothetical protein